MAATETPTQTEESTTDRILSELLTSKMAEALSKAQSPTVTSEPAALPIGIKLDGSSYGLWSQVVEMYISGKDKLGYINGELTPPSPTDLSFRKWRTDNAIVKGWLINSMDPTLIGNFIRFPTAKQVWDSAATTYFDGGDTSQVYDLRRRVSRLRQAGGSLEKYYTNLQGLWREIDFRRLNPMECPADIQRYNNLLQEDRVYVFLDGLDDKLDNIRSDVLQLHPFPTIEQAYAYVRREALRQMVMNAGDHEPPQGAVLASRGLKLGIHGSNPQHAGKSGSKGRSSSDGLKCTHCGNMKHTRENCFQLHGYPDWWHELQARKKQDTAGTSTGIGKAAVAVVEPCLSLIPQQNFSSVDQGNPCHALISSHCNTNRDDWLLDSGATDHMTFDPADLTHYSSPRRTSIANANGVVSPVTGAGSVT
ncbi:hypothetical protein AB3S75_018199 [Citrus x aurantiifolia]